ncbi:MAG: VWA domain-containing protein [Pseudomonadota bacterium]
MELKQKLANLQGEGMKLKDKALSAEKSVKKAGLGEHVAAVALVMDISGSMRNMFSDGTVQAVIERVMGLGLNFDDNGAIDIFAFGQVAHDLGELLPEDFAGASQWIIQKTRFEGHTHYAPVIDLVLEHYGYSSTAAPPPAAPAPTAVPWWRRMLGEKPAPSAPADPAPRGKLPASYPAYVLFVTDGDNQDKAEAQAALTRAARFPVFFQFVGVGAGSFAFLEHLDQMKGRFIDNANFFSVRDPKAVSDEQLYELMLQEYPSWLELARGRNILS